MIHLSFVLGETLARYLRTNNSFSSNHNAHGCEQHGGINFEHLFMRCFMEGQIIQDNWKTNYSIDAQEMVVVAKSKELDNTDSYWTDMDFVDILTGCYHD